MMGMRKLVGSLYKALKTDKISAEIWSASGSRLHFVRKINSLFASFLSVCI